MTRMEKVLADNPLLVPEMLVTYHCHAEYGLLKVWPPDACPPGGMPCRECWNREIPCENEMEEL